MQNVTLSGYILVPDEDLATVIAELPKHIALTKEEPGCLSFSVTQSSTEKNRFNVDERFESKSAFELHQRRVKASHWGKITTNVERHYKIE